MAEVVRPGHMKHNSPSVTIFDVELNSLSGQCDRTAHVVRGRRAASLGDVPSRFSRLIASD